VTKIWHSGLKTIRPPIKIYLPARLAEYLKMLSEALAENEFLLFLAGNWQEGEIWVFNWYFPYQKGSSVTVEAQEEPPAGFSGVLHKHPPGCRSFSATDAKYLNPNYEFSLLYIPPAEFPQSLVHIFIKEEWRLRLEGEVKIVNPQEEVSKNLIKYHKEEDINEKSQNQRGTLRGFLS
jgi:hypothetical protein